MHGFKEIASSEFHKNSGKYKDMAHKEPIVITKHGRPYLVLISYHHYEEITQEKNND